KAFPGKDDGPTDAIEVTAEELAKAYQENEAAADVKYKDKWLLVEGKLQDVSFDDESATGRLEGVKGVQVRCFATLAESNKVWNLSRGQTVTFKGKCTGGGTRLTFVRLEHCRVESFGQDPAIKIQATKWIAEFAKNSDAANLKYQDKEVTVTDAVFQSIEGDLANFTSPTKGSPYKIQVRFTGTPKSKLAELNPGDRVRFKARCGGLFDKTIANYDGYLVP
ncbi:MAG: OB-fold putative lipoprotein, partial [Planctomycetia bacterium]|nr:OB-fold putative lipoprotein [Planctomycetia bacterium]